MSIDLCFCCGFDLVWVCAVGNVRDESKCEGFSSRLWLKTRVNVDESKICDAMTPTDSSSRAFLPHVCAFTSSRFLVVSRDSLFLACLIDFALRFAFSRSSLTRTVCGEAHTLSFSKYFEDSLNTY